jgi:predicted 3-demethylubiquinone-9 3-methyltransferase (glyoxalase superfamily)
MAVTTHQKITPFLWFDNNAEDAMNHYLSIFKNSRVRHVQRNGPGGPGPTGAVLVASFELEGQHFNALNGGPAFKFSEAISFVVTCESQQEVDDLWHKLCAGGSHGQCGWLKDKFGLSWQIVPSVFFELLQDPDPTKSARVMAAMMQMTKFDIAALRRAHQG